MVQSVFATDSPHPTVLGVLQYGQLSRQPRQLPTTQATQFNDSEVRMQDDAHTQLKVNIGCL
jgi:hypothetical protein